MDTALQLKMGPIAITGELNAIFQSLVERARQNAALKDFIYRLDAERGPYVMVTHRANNEALIGQPLGDGREVVSQLTGKRSISFEQIPSEWNKDRIIGDLEAIIATLFSCGTRNLVSLI